MLKPLLAYSGYNFIDLLINKTMQEKECDIILLSLAKKACHIIQHAWPPF
jgi:hypothetical protein